MQGLGEAGEVPGGAVVRGRELWGKTVWEPRGQFVVAAAERGPNLDAKFGGTGFGLLTCFTPPVRPPTL